MKRFALICAMLVACCSSFAVAAPAAVKPITGQVVNQKGKAVAGASVYVFKTTIAWISDGPAATLKADKNGKFTYRPKTADETARTRAFAAWAPGYACTGDEMLGGNAPIKIVLSPESKFKGKAVDENGKPLAGVTVSVVAHMSQGPDGEMLYLMGSIPGKMTSKTSKDGSFVIKGIPDPTKSNQFHAYLRVEGKGRDGSIKGFSGPNMASGITVVAQPACTLEAALSMPEGSGPVPKDIKFRIMVSNGRDYYVKVTGLDANDRFTLNDLPPGNATVSLVTDSARQQAGNGPQPTEPPTWVFAKPTTPELKAAQLTKLDLVLCKGAIVKGVVSDKNTGKPVPKAAICFSHKDIPRPTRAGYAITNDQGRFEWRVSPGTVTVSLERVGDKYMDRNGASVEITVANGDEKTDIALEYDPEAVTQYSSGPKPIPPDFEIKPGEYDLAWDPELDCSGAMSSRVVKVGAKLEPLIKNAPVLKSKNAYWAGFGLDGTGDSDLLAVIIDESEGSGKGFDTAYIDVNRNWDLSDDKPVKLSTRDQSRYLNTDRVTIQARQGKEGSTVSNPIQVSLYTWADDKRIAYCYLSRRGAWKGTIDTTKGKVECAVLDTDSNGLYGDPAQWNEKNYMGRGDQFFVDANGLGHVSASYWGGHRFGLYPATRVGSKFYVIAFNDVGNHVKVQPYSGPMGQVIVRGTDINGAKAQAMNVSLYGRQGAYEFEDVKGQPITVPAGEYRINDCNLNLLSKDGSMIPIRCVLNNPVCVEEDKAATVDISGKVTAKFNPGDKKLAWKPGETSTLDWAISIGNMATICSIGNSCGAYAPTVKFINAKGKVVANAKGQFG